MLNRLTNALRGKVRLEVEGAFPERLLNLCAQRGILFWNVEWLEATRLRFTVTRQGAGAAIELVEMDKRESRLRQALAPIADRYDYIFIDCPPALDLLTLNGLCAADTVLVPIQCEFFALEGLSELMSTVRTVKKMYNKYIELEGVLLTMYDGRLNLTLQVVQEVKKFFGDKVYATTIPRNVRLAEAPSYGMPVNYYDPASKGTAAYAELAKELLRANKDL